MNPILCIAVIYYWSLQYAGCEMHSKMVKAYKWQSYFRYSLVRNSFLSGDDNSDGIKPLHSIENTV